MAKGGINPLGRSGWINWVDEYSELDEMIFSTVEGLGPANFTDISSDLQQHIAMKELLACERVCMDGTGITFNLAVNPNFKPREMVVLS